MSLHNSVDNTTLRRTSCLAGSRKDQTCKKLVHTWMQVRPGAAPAGQQPWRCGRLGLGRCCSTALAASPPGSLVQVKATLWSAPRPGPQSSAGPAPSQGGDKCARRTPAGWPAFPSPVSALRPRGRPRVATSAMVSVTLCSPPLSACDASRWQCSQVEAEAPAGSRAFLPVHVASAAGGGDPGHSGLCQRELVSFVL